MGYLAQVITALAEIGISYRLLLASIQEVFPQHAIPAAIVGSVIVTIFLEVGLRKFLPFSFRAILYRRFSGLHLLISIPVLVITVSLIVALAYLSIQGSHEIIRQIAPEPVLLPENSMLSRFEQDRQQIWMVWRGDSVLLEQKYGALERGVEARYRRKMEQNNSYFIRKETELNTLQRRKLEAILEASKRRDERLDQVDQERKAALEQLNLANQAAVFSATDRINQYGGGLAWFTLIAMGVFIFSIGIEEVHRKGSGITEVVIPGHYSFRPGLVDELKWAVENRLNYRLRAKIKEFEALTPLLEEIEVNLKSDHLNPNAIKYYKKTCKQCGKLYQERTTWQIFCCTNCRIAFHESKQDRNYLSNRFYRAREKKLNGMKLSTELFEGVNEE
jgi:ribosomal protein L37AE/L43A